MCVKRAVICLSRGAVTDDRGSGAVLKDTDGSPSDMKVHRNTQDEADVLRS